MKRTVILMCALAVCLCASSQEDSIVDNHWKADISDGWFVQMGGDWTIQKPYGHPASEMIKNGSSFGIDAAVGKRFTHEMGVRMKASWGNGIIDSRADWLAPFNNPGENHRKGGFLSVVGDIMFDLHNVIGGYNAERIWNAGLFLRGGGVYNFGVDKGSPLIGLGWSNQFRLSDKWGMYADVAYNGVSSGFSMDPSTATGVGSGSNMYFTVDVGVTYNIGGARHELKDDVGSNTFKDKSFWKNWFLQFGADMTLYNPCEHDFKDVFPKGMAMGMDVALGKWFSPEIGARFRLNLENCLIENKKMEWLAYDEEKHTSNYDGGGCVMAYFDVLLSAKHIFKGYTKGEKWDLYGFGRMGLGKNRSIDSLSPVVGAGFGGTYRISKRWSIYADTAYEGITSEFFSGVSWSGATGGKFNGIWDFNLGMQVDL